MKPLTVVFVAWAPFFSGAERALLITATGLAEAGHNVSVVVGTNGELREQLHARGIRTTHIPLPYVSAARVGACLSSALKLASWLRRERADILHSNDVPSFQLAGYVARMLGVPAVTHVRFPDSSHGFSWFLKPGFRRALFVSDYLRRDAEAAAPTVFAGRSEVVYDGVELPEIPGADERARLRQDLGIPTDRPAVLFAGQVVEIKGIFDFIEAVAYLAAEGVGATFVVMGDDLKGQGAGRREAEARVQARGLAPYVKFLGYRADAPALISLFDIVAVPSHVEPLGNATLEAMAAARPVVGSRVGGIPEMVVDELTGLLVPAHSPRQLADGLARLIADPDESARFGRAGRDRAVDVFGVRAHAARVEDVYRNVIGRQF
ncbi:MAG: glycosyltransferase family 4 protein [Vicinamibacterales bacterium]